MMKLNKAGLFTECEFQRTYRDLVFRRLGKHSRQRLMTEVHDRLQRRIRQAAARTARKERTALRNF